MNIKIRKATLNDLDVLLEFEQYLITIERPMDPSLEQTKNIRYYDISAFITSDKSTLYVATSADKIIGCGYGLIMQNKSKFAQKEHGFIGFVFVKEKYRGNSISKLIMNAINNWFRTKNITEVRLTVYEHNYNAIKAYEKLGFKKNIVEMLYNLD